jgi:hypothetical protein
LPVRRHRSGRSRHRLIQRMRVRALQLRSGESLSCPIVVKPSFARLKARDNRVTSRRVVLRCMLIGRRVTAADVTAFGTSAKMKPPLAGRRAFHATCSAWLGGEIDAIPLRRHRPTHWNCSWSPRMRSRGGLVPSPPRPHFASALSDRSTSRQSIGWVECSETHNGIQVET